MNCTRPHRRRRAGHAAAAAAAAVLVATVTGCDLFRPAGGGSGGGTGVPADAPVSVGIGDPERLVPGDTVDPAGLQVLDALFTPLVRVRSGRIEMAAARSVTSADRKVWTVTLQEGHRFTDGQPVTADSYLRAWNFTAYGPNRQQNADLFSRIAGYDRMQSPDGAAKPRATTLAGLKKTGELTFQVTLDRPYAEFPNLLAAHAFDPLPDAAFGAGGTIAAGYAQAPVGNGRYRIRGAIDRAAGVIPLVSVGDNPAGRPRTARVDLRINTDPRAAYRELAAGRLDVLPQVPSADLGRAKADLDGRLQRTPSSYLAYLAVPAYLPQLENPDLRRAVSMAIDRPAVVREVFLDTYRPAASWTSPVVPGGRADGCGTACRHDPAAARELYQKAGGLPGNTLEIVYNAGGGHQEWVRTVCDQVRANLGITCTATPLPLDELTRRTDAGTLPGLLADAWSLDYPSVENYLGPPLRRAAGHNNSRYASGRFDALLDRAAAAGSDAEALAAYRQAEDVVAADLPTIPLWFRDTVSARSARMAPLSVDLSGIVDLGGLHTR